MAELLRAIPSIATVVFSVSAMLSVGVSHTAREVLGPLRNWRVVLRALIASFVLVPLLTVGVVRAFRLGPTDALALLLLATGAGAPFVIKLARVADSEVRKTATLLVLLVVATVVYMPLVVPVILREPSFGRIAVAPVEAGAITRPLLATVIAPLIVGLALRAKAAAAARRMQPVVGKVASISLVVIIVGTIVANLGAMARFAQTAALPAAIAFHLGAFFIGYLLGGRRRERRVVLGLGTGQRNVPAAMIVATQSFDSREGPLTSVVAASVLGLAVLFLLALALRRSGARPHRRLRELGRGFGAPVR